MLSRRNVRVKAMQALYSASRDAELKNRDVIKIYMKSVDTAFCTLVSHLYLLQAVAQRALQDQSNRKSKHLPDEFDRAFTPIIYTNELTKSLRDNDYLNKKLIGCKLKPQLNDETAKQIYLGFAKQRSYEDYIFQPNKTNQDHADMLLELYRYMLSNETFLEKMDELFPAYHDDKSLVNGSGKKIVKSLPLVDDDLEKYYPDDEAVDEFGTNLLEAMLEKDEHLVSLIAPILKNWDVERVAVIDMILLKMATSELLYFNTIPTKVTLNEYVELAKQYSTDKSKDFINGVVDKLVKSLSEEGLINKTGRGLEI